MIDNEKARIAREVSIQNLKKKPKLSKKTANSFNLAAFAFPVIYNFIYKRKGLAIAFLILTWIPHFINHFVSSGFYLTLVITISIFTLLLAFISGLTGNKDAYDARNYDDEIDFLKSQKCWLPFSLAAIIVHILILPMQITGHTNTIQMMKLAETKDILKQAVVKGLNEGNILGVNTVENNIPAYFAKYLAKGKFNGTDTITMPNGTTFKIEGYLYECGSKKENTYYEQKTSCATVTIDLNGQEAPNEATTMDELDKIRSLVNRSTRLKDIYTLYVYNDDLAAKAGTVEQFALERFEK